MRCPPPSFVAAGMVFHSAGELLASAFRRRAQVAVGATGSRLMIWHLMAIVLIRTNVFISHLRPLTLRLESALPIKEREESQGKGYRVFVYSLRILP